MNFRTIVQTIAGMTPYPNTEGGEIDAQQTLNRLIGEAQEIIKREYAPPPDTAKISVDSDQHDLYKERYQCEECGAALDTLHATGCAFAPESERRYL